MVSIIKKVKNGRAYYYAARSARVNGKPRITWQKYLGSVEGIIERCQQNLAPLPSETALFEAGGVAMLLKLAERLGLIDLINEEVPKRDQGPSVGHYIVLAALNRALDPTSKCQIGEWYHETVLQRLWNFDQEMFSSKRFWDHMDMVSERAIQRVQDRLGERVRKEFSINTQPLLYDSTNFFTFIDTHNDRNTIAQRGHNKQKRTDFRQVNLALLATRDFQIPLFHKLYRGDVPDVKSFPEVTRDLLRRHKAIFGDLTDATLVFDKGNLSEESREKLLYSKTYFVAAAKADLAPEILTAPLNQFQSLPLHPGTRVYETTIELSGKTCKALAVYSDSFFTEQLASLSATMAKCQDKLKELQKQLLSWSDAKKNPRKKSRGPRPVMAKIRERVKDILSPQYMKDVFSFSLENIEGIPYLRYTTNKPEIDRLITSRLGRTLLITNRKNWLPPEIVTAYRSLVNIEEAFKHMKNRDYLRWQPAFHWTDQKLHVHTFYCVLALLLVTLARKIACEAGHDISLHALLDDLSAIKEVALLYPIDNGKIKAQFGLSKMTPRQKKLGELFNIGDILVTG